MKLLHHSHSTNGVRPSDAPGTLMGKELMNKTPQQVRVKSRLVKLLFVATTVTLTFILILSSTTIPFPLHYWNVVFHREEAIFKQLKQGRLVTYQFTFQDSSWVRIHFHPQFDLLFRMYHGGIYLLTSDGRQRKYICDYSPCGFALGFEDEDIGIFNRMSVQECSLSELDEIIISYAGSSCFVAEQGDASEDIKTSGDSKVQE